MLSTLKLRHDADWKSLEAETAMGWMRRNGYGRALDAVWGPLLRQKYGRRAEDVGLVWLWGKISLRTRSRDKTGLGERLGYLKGSFGRGVAAVLARVKERGGDVRTSRPVRIVKRSRRRLRRDLRGTPEEARNRSTSSSRRSRSPSS